MDDLIIISIIALYHIIMGEGFLQAIQVATSWGPTIVNFSFAFASISIAVTSIALYIAKGFGPALVYLSTILFLIVAYFISHFLATQMALTFAMADTIQNVNWISVAATLLIRYLISSVAATLLPKALPKP